MATKRQWELYNSLSEYDRKQVTQNMGRSWVYVIAKAYGLKRNEIDAVLAVTKEQNN